MKAAGSSNDPPPSSCQQTLTLSFFFDGTGNNFDADIGTWEHSNVARLYRAHKRDYEPEGRYRFYLPGIGTYFKDREVNDPGGTLTGRSFGALGQARLDWAFARLKETIHVAERQAQNPTNKICWIKVSAFGFSRGAALARAFARDLQKLCSEDSSSSTGWRLRAGGYPIEIVFLGLWDTVASAGLPPSANNFSQRNRYAKALGAALSVASIPVIGVGPAAAQMMQTPELKRLAFGEPGADPAPGSSSGHSLWAEQGMAIGGMVKRCVHMIAGHELRNSFASDSVLYERRPDDFDLPANTVEFVYPGVHSDVGGGYRPGECGCRPEKGAQLSLIALRAMHEFAIQADVPLVPLSGLTQIEKEDFALDAEGTKQYALTLDLWQHYLQHRNSYAVPGAKSGIGGEMVKHMRAYYAWRFMAIRLNRAAAKAGKTTEQQAQITAHEAGFASDRKKLNAELADAARALSEAQQRQEISRTQLESAQLDQARLGTPINPATMQKYEQAKRNTEQKQIQYDRVRARISTAADDGGLNGAIAKYDQMLYDDAAQIVEWLCDDEKSEAARQAEAELAQLKAEKQQLEMRRSGEQANLMRSGRGVDPRTLLPTPQGQRLADEINAQYDPQIKRLQARIAELKARQQPQTRNPDKHLSKLRPHYRALVDAYLDEFERGKGLTDPKVIAFFDDYVHDSLAGFDKDETWPSDPRMIFVGGDRKLRFAMLDGMEPTGGSMAA